LGKPANRPYASQIDAHATAGRQRSSQEHSKAPRGVTCWSAQNCGYEDPDEVNATRVPRSSRFVYC
jgi:hypothetical protein